MLYMSSVELKRRYIESADKKKQIKILAELNACTQEIIVQALIDAGCKDLQKKSTCSEANEMEEKKMHEVKTKEVTKETNKTNKSAGSKGVMTKPVKAAKKAKKVEVKKEEKPKEEIKTYVSDAPERPRCVGKGTSIKRGPKTKQQTIKESIEFYSKPEKKPVKKSRRKPSQLRILESKTTPDTIRDLYVTKGYRVSDIAKEIDTTEAILRQYLRKYKILKERHINSKSAEKVPVQEVVDKTREVRADNPGIASIKYVPITATPRPVESQQIKMLVAPNGLTKSDAIILAAYNEQIVQAQEEVARLTRLRDNFLSQL